MELWPSFPRLTMFEYMDVEELITLPVLKVYANLILSA